MYRIHQRHYRSYCIQRANVMHRYAILHKSYDNCSFINTPLYWIHHCIFCTYRNVFNGLFLIHTICISLRIFWIHISKIHSLQEGLVYFKNRFHLIMLTRTYLRIIAVAIHQLGYKNLLSPRSVNNLWANRKKVSIFSSSETHTSFQ